MGTDLMGSEGLNKKKICMVVLVCLIMCIISISEWKLWGYLLLENVQLPEDSEIVDRRVSISDVMGMHIREEEIISSELKFDEIHGRIIKDNPYTIIYVEEITNGFLDWDDCGYTYDKLNEITNDHQGKRIYYLNVDHQLWIICLLLLQQFFWVGVAIIVISSLRKEGRS